MGDWHGTGYIVTNPETGAGAYMISGGLNGGSVSTLIDEIYIFGMMCAEFITAAQFQSIRGSVGLICEGIVFGSDLLACYGMVTIISSTSTIINMVNKISSWTEKYYDYIISDDEEKGLKLARDIVDTMKNQSLGDALFNSWSVLFNVLKEYI